jgi:4-hydroxy-3-polyprenylbenzoate decarboxylase
MRGLLEHQPDLGLDLVISEAGQRVLREEEGIKLSLNDPDLEVLVGGHHPRVRYHHIQDIGASIASGSHRSAGMVIVPCSMGTLGKIACGSGSNLIHRAAEVTLKEGRSLIIVPRETPLSAIHLENLLKLARNGARIVPAMPGFYHRPQSISQITEMMAMRIADQMGFDLPLAERWKAGAR